METAENIEERIRKLYETKLTSNAEMDRKILDNAFEIMDKAIQVNSNQKQNARRITMRARIVKISIAAAVAVVILLGLNLFNAPGVTGVVWAEVVKNVENISTFTYRMQQSEKTVGKEDMQKSDVMIYNSSELGTRMDTYQGRMVKQSTYTLRKEKAIIVVMHLIKKYVRRPLNEAALKEMDEKEPRDVIKKLMSVKYKKLGRDTIDGIEVEGVEVNDPSIVNSNEASFESFACRLWVNVETELPVLLELELVAGKGDTKKEIKITMNDFQWNKDLDTSIFTPDIPEDYELLEE